MTDHEIAILIEHDRAERRVVAEIAPVDPADVLVISGYVFNVSRGRMRVDHVFSVDGQVYADVGLAHPSHTDPPDITTYRLDRVERNVDGVDAECIELNAVEWRDGSKSYEPTGDAL